MQQKYEKKLINRLNRIEGQVRGLKRMVEKGQYCPDILTQSLAVENSLESFNAQLLENHLFEHVTHQFQHGQSQTAIKELIKIYNLANK
ncbi:MAG: metal-sensitive transcriptional regulator [Candidatus Doudnabacteria bacterium]|nr:metal-sensitive transcriptional regulator [Candidatus Doudnabacteria bacterium]